MIFTLFLNDNLVNVELLNKNHIKHCYLRVIKKDLIQIKANKYFTLSDAKNLIEDKKDWINKSIENRLKKELNEDEFLLLGEKKLKEDYTIKNIDTFYKDICKTYIPKFIEKYQVLMNLYPAKISYRKNRRTWGSCNYKNELNFNINLAKYPLNIMEYIVIHELSHIKHKNHSKDFWTLVKEFSPNYKEIEKEFKSLL
ncbi:WLM domain protein [Aliarcobacter thereius]|uniref:M48 family metallopeptidase n=1 Tax=Aliarcobacter thereius TaxID=544718 RepID=UPI000827AE29|nr:M48 family metallopeptidase [Aliarcobacter thereius]OCL86811.1 WLM domain protein [Aliarcobacter thereius]